jgi:hypothetical protein
VQQRGLDEARDLSEGFVHYIADPAVHALEDVRVGVQRLRYGSVSQKFLAVLGMDVAVEQQLTCIPSPQRLMTSPFTVLFAAPIPKPGLLSCILSTASLPTARGVGDWQAGKMVATPVPGKPIYSSLRGGEAVWSRLLVYGC